MLVRTNIFHHALKALKLRKLGFPRWAPITFGGWKHNLNLVDEHRFWAFRKIRTYTQDEKCWCAR
jgi:hypothetical protein